MTMTADGLAKLLEESGELSEVAAQALSDLLKALGRLNQVAGKKLAYFHTDEHPDGGVPLSERLEDEMGDVEAATAELRIAFTAQTFSLDVERIESRKQRKLAQYQEWHLDPNN
jgi:hypothetical protein